MRPLLASLAFVAAATAASAILAGLLSTIQWKLLAVCDPKLGCDTGVGTAVLFSAVVALGASFALAMFTRAASAFAAFVPSTRQGLGAALAVAALAALWVTSAGWR